MHASVEQLTLLYRKYIFDHSWQGCCPQWQADSLVLKAQGQINWLGLEIFWPLENVVFGFGLGLDYFFK